MAAKKKSKKPKPSMPDAPDMGEALEGLERPSMNWKITAQVAVGLLVIWFVAGIAQPYLGIWGFVGAGVLTLIAAGFGVYVWRLTQKSADIVEILKGATDAEGRAEAIAKLEGKGGDAMAKMAQAQLVGQEDPKEALRILESIDIKKAPTLVQNDVRAQLGYMYLLHNKTQDARTQADAIKLDVQSDPKQKAMYAAVMAEAWARTGKERDAASLLEDYSADDEAYAEVRALLYRAEVFTWLKMKKRGRARTAMMRLAGLDPNQLGAFLQKGTHPEVARLAREVLEKGGFVPKLKMQMQRVR